jgi:drug/metabolite transporter (DMT)-like permease
MEIHDNAIVGHAEALPLRRIGDGAGLIWGALGVFAFSLTLPATKIAVRSIDAQVVGLGRALVAAICALLLLMITRQPLPPRRLWWRLAVVALGVVFGFPLLSALALRSVPSSHAAMVVGLLPAANALTAVLRAGERPSAGFWIASVVGFAAIAVFCSQHGLGTLHGADLLLLGAVLSAAVGYTEGALVARELGAWQVICWALLLSAPIVAPLVGVRLWTVGFNAGAQSLGGFAYVSLISMFLGFFAWYRGLALGGIARVGQLQLMQPILTLLWSHWLLAEAITPLHLITAAVVLVSVGSALRLRSHEGAHVTRPPAASPIQH